MKLGIGLIQLHANPKTETFIAELFNSVHAKCSKKSKGLKMFNLKKNQCGYKIKEQDNVNTKIYIYIYYPPKL